jgi:hypothetical protein
MVTDNESCHWILASIFMTAAIAIMLTQRYVPDHVSLPKKIPHNMITFTMIACVVPGSTMKSEMF